LDVHGSAGILRCKGRVSSRLKCSGGGLYYTQLQIVFNKKTAQDVFLKNSPTKDVDNPRSILDF
jgi:hypothetical protein